MRGKARQRFRKVVWIPGFGQGFVFDRATVLQLMFRFLGIEASSAHRFASGESVGGLGVQAIG
jgi:hypothetical protein